VNRLRQRVGNGAGWVYEDGTSIDLLTRHHDALLKGTS
jgi:hypothetical protein